MQIFVFLTSFTPFGHSRFQRDTPFLSSPLLSSPFFNFSFSLLSFYPIWENNVSPSKYRSVFFTSWYKWKLFYLCLLSHHFHYNSQLFNLQWRLIHHSVWWRHSFGSVLFLFPLNSKNSVFKLWDEVYLGVFQLSITYSKMFSRWECSVRPPYHSHSLPMRWPAEIHRLIAMPAWHTAWCG
jgi:hypothetical protein